LTFCIGFAILFADKESEMKAKLIDSWEDQYENGGKSFCIDGVHIGFRMYSPDGFRNSNAPRHGWEVTGPCDGSCNRFIELDSSIVALISRFKETGQPQELQGGPWPKEILSDANSLTLKTD
jgi:hypothetical protein